MISKLGLFLVGRQKTVIEKIQLYLNEKQALTNLKVIYSDHMAKPSRGVVENYLRYWNVSRFAKHTEEEVKEIKVV